MRNAVVMMTSISLGLVVMMIVMTINGRINRTMEITSNLSSAAEEVLENMMLDSKYTIQNTNAFIADFVETLSMTIDADSDISVDILQCDKERGILSVRVTLFYDHPNGNQGTTSCEKHVILNKIPQVELKSCRVLFYVEEELYKEYVLTEGSVLQVPVVPSVSSGTFYGWIDGTGASIDFSQPVLQDMVCYANVG